MPHGIKGFFELEREEFLGFDCVRKKNDFHYIAPSFMTNHTIYLEFLQELLRIFVRENALQRKGFYGRILFVFLGVYALSVEH